MHGNFRLLDEEIMMRCMSWGECEEWVRQRVPTGTVLEPGSPLRAFLRMGYKSMRQRHPKDSGAKTSVAKQLCGFVSEDRPSFVCVDNCDIWPSSGHLPLLARLRESLGERRSINEFPGHIFEASERDDAISLVMLAMQFYWDCWVVSDDARRIAFVSHDEFFNFFSPEEGLIQKYQASVRGG